MRLWLRLGVFVSVAWAFGLSSCGSGGAASCGTTQPCGGDPTGTWKIVASCAPGANSALQNAQCPSATGTAHLSTTGTLSFNADQSYALAMTTSGSVDIQVPASCLVMGGLTVTCSQLGLLIAAGGQGTSASCTGTSACACTLTVPAMATNEMGTWSTAGTDLALVPTAPGTETGGPYCVKGNELHLVSVDTTMPMGAMGSATIISDIVATK